MEAGRRSGQLLLFWITLALDFSPAVSQPLLYYTNRSSIRYYDLETGNTDKLRRWAFGNVIAMHFHLGNKKLYVGDVRVEKLYLLDLNTGRGSALLYDLVVHSLAVDWINNNLYWTDTGNTTTRPHFQLHTYIFIHWINNNLY